MQYITPSNKIAMNNRLIANFEHQVRLAESNFMSRWTFERLLSNAARSIVREIQNTISGHQTTQLGCAILYRIEKYIYYVGGASSDRRKMKRSARIYDLTPASQNPGNERARKSFTGFGIAHNARFVLDDFELACDEFRPTIEHELKNTELGSKKTKSYVFIPIVAADAPSVDVRDLLQLKAMETEFSDWPNQIVGALRISSNSEGIASTIFDSLHSNYLGKLFHFIISGQETLRNRGKDYALAIADFHSDLLQFRNSEYGALEQLASHMQCLFEKSECSVFVANQRHNPDEAGTKISLTLAATTALANDDENHRKFLECFFDQGNHYECEYSETGHPMNLNKASKTEKAYFNPLVPIMANLARGDTTNSTKFSNIGEVDGCPSFLAVAIPSFDESSKPYGVLRIIRESWAQFDSAEAALAVAVAHSLGRWAQFFPRNPGLKIEWNPDVNKSELIQTVFGLARLSANTTCRFDSEVNWLLQKIFFKSEKIEVIRTLSGRSGSAVLLVRNDVGLDLIVKFRRITDPNNRVRPDDITAEIENYQKYVEGKLPLNHNVIYPELIRETRNLRGFATSFMALPDVLRMSVTDYCSQAQHLHRDVQWTLARVIEKLVSEVWAWWYTPSPKTIVKESVCKLDEFVNKEMLFKDPLFDFFGNMKKFDEKLRSDLSAVFGPRDYSDGATPIPRPSEIWENLTNAAAFKTIDVEWRSTVTHGDTHGDNIFFDPRTLEMWIIDFGRTTRRTDIFDLAMLEADLKYRQLGNLMNIAHENRFLEFWTAYRKFEHTLASQRTYDTIVIPNLSATHPMLDVVGKLVVDIRQLACQRLGRFGSFADYQAVSLVLAFKYMKVPNLHSRCKAMAYHSAREIAGSFQKW